MADNRIELTPREILVHLLDVEKVAPRKDFRMYVPTKVSESCCDNSMLVREAKRMMEFVGLYDFTFDITYTKTEEGTAGCCENNGMEKSVHIQVSENFINDWQSSLAVLAHELCHKILFYCGLFRPISIMNEVYAELATIYFGFADLIMAGYNTNNHCMGYLTPDTYKKINLLVCVVCGNIKSDMLNLKDIDPLADEAVELWESETDKKQLRKNCFVKAEEQIAEYYKNIRLVEQILAQCKKDVKSEFERLDKMYFVDFRNTNRSPLDTFLFLYNNFCICEHRSERVEKLNSVVLDSLYNLYSVYQEQGTLELKVDAECPKCGLRREIVSGGNRFVAKRCGNSECGLNITFDVEPWNVTTYQRIANQKRKMRKEAFDTKVDKRVQEVKRGYDEQLRAIRSQATAKIDEIKRNEQQRTREEILSKIPSCLRWIVSRYINK